MAVSRGYHFFINPGPTNIPDRVLRAMDRGAIDFNGAQFRAIAEECVAGLKRVFKTDQTVLSYAASGHGAWEAALVNLFSPGDKVLVVESGYFSLNWGMRGEAFGLEVETLANDWRTAADPARLESRLREDREHAIKAVLVVHNETSTGVVNDIDQLRRAIDSARHPALFLVDTISSLASMDFRMDEWGVDVTVAGSQKGLMLPTGMAFTGVSARAIAAAAEAKLPRVYWDWRRLLGTSAQAHWNGTVPVHFFFGLQEALRMLEEEGLDNVFARHHRLAEATRRAVHAWRQNDGPEIFASDPRAQSNSITAVQVPEGCDADKVRQIALDKFNVSLGGGLDRLRGHVFRIGHLGDLNEPMILGAIAAVEMALELTGVPHGRGGVQAAMDYLVSSE
ncbi:MAG TPA: aminotransferase class V-fold PLP-dependent enzyme [Stellaceae bacterium]|jgi:alanine-glyoxylate transaminase / serine-glyoxylate transaminase / serine-pyruvate transaminase|nr:aminotransferase class V-fold PLP-dependent enzyme [Stellaceae bacterium]